MRYDRVVWGRVRQVPQSREYSFLSSHIIKVVDTNMAASCCAKYNGRMSKTGEGSTKRILELKLKKKGRSWNGGLRA